MQAAEHGADFPMARKVRASMTHDQLHDFAVGSEKHKPEHMRHAGSTEHSHRGNSGRKPRMRHGE
jgi:hypothetical protein